MCHFSAETEFSERKGGIAALILTRLRRRFVTSPEAFQELRRKSSQADDVNVFGILEDFTYQFIGWCLSPG